MSYTKTTWATDDTITAEKLNHAEQGIYDASVGPLTVHGTAGEGGTVSIDTPLANIIAAWDAGRKVELETTIEGYGETHIPMAGYTILNNTPFVYFNIITTSSGGSQLVGLDFVNSTDSEFVIVQLSNT